MAGADRHRAAEFRRPASTVALGIDPEARREFWFAVGPTQTYFLLFALMPQLWMFLTTRWAVSATFAVVTAMALIQLGRTGWKWIGPDRSFRSRSCRSR